MEIPVGKGIVGSVAETGKAELIKDTSKDPRYIVDDQLRYSEISVPIISDNKVLGRDRLRALKKSVLYSTAFVNSDHNCVLVRE